MSDDDRSRPIDPAEQAGATPTSPTPTSDAPQESTMNDDQDTRPAGAGDSPTGAEGGTGTGPRTGARTTEPQPWDVDDAPRTGAPATPGARTPAPVATDVRVGTIVWGLVLAAVGVGFLALAAGFTFDVELAFIAIVALAGVGLVAGAVITAVRRNRHG